MFEKQCTKLNIIHKNLLLDVDTRWNSTLIMLERARDYKRPLLATVKLIKSLNGIEINREDMWKKIDKLIEVLKPFEEATRLISQGHFPSLLDTECVYQYLFNNLEKYTEKTEQKLLSTRSRTHLSTDEDGWLRIAATAGWEKLKKYYASSEALVYVVATVMDPRFKLHWFEVAWKKEFVDQARTKLTHLWNSKYKNANNCDRANPTRLNPQSLVLQPPSTIQPVECGITNLLAKKMEKFHKQDDDSKRYLKEPVIHPGQIAGCIGGALSWWKTHENDYPMLSKMAKDYLAVSATGVPVERLFSNGPDLLAPKRQRLKSETIQQCMCLKQWMKAGDGRYSIHGFKDALELKLGISTAD